MNTNNQIAKTDQDHGRNGKSLAERSSESRAWATPAVDILEGRDEYVVVADVPGVSREGLKVEYKDRQLLLQGSRNADAGGSTLSTDYRRVFTVSEEIDTEKMSAELRNGVLIVHLPKAEAAKPRHIPIHAGS